MDKAFFRRLADLMPTYFDETLGCKSIFDDEDRQVGFTVGLADEDRDEANANLVCELHRFGAQLLEGDLTDEARSIARTLLKGVTPGAWSVQVGRYEVIEIAAEGEALVVMDSGAYSRQLAELITGLQNELRGRVAEA